MTLDSLANPIRRLVLRRIAEGPCSFTQAMEAAHIDDTLLIAFHLRTLSEGGLITHEPRERYRLTPRGNGAIKILTSIDELDSGEGSGNRIFPSKSPKQGASQPEGRAGTQRFTNRFEGIPRPPRGPPLRGDRLQGVPCREAPIPVRPLLDSISGTCYTLPGGRPRRPRAGSDRAPEGEG